MTPRIYISGALTDVPDPRVTKRFYEAIKRVCEEAGFEVYLPHLHSDPEEHPNLSPEDVFEKDKREVLASDIVVAYVGVPSLGVGMELAYAEGANLPVILLGESERRISRFPLGIPTLVGMIRFSESQQALDALRSCLDALPAAVR